MLFSSKHFFDIYLIELFLYKFLYNKSMNKFILREYSNHLINLIFLFWFIQRLFEA